jgi:hypothetical protein
MAYSLFLAVLFAPLLRALTMALVNDRPQDVQLPIVCPKENAVSVLNASPCGERYQLEELSQRSIGVKMVV